MWKPKNGRTGSARLAVRWNRFLACLLYTSVEEGTQPISHGDYERLIQYLEKKNPPAILPIQIAYYAGLRIGETCGLTWQDINLEEQCLTIKRSIRYDGCLLYTSMQVNIG